MSLNEKMTALADAIREKTDKTELLSIDGMTAAVAEMVRYGDPLRTIELTDAAVHQRFQWDGSTPEVRLQAAMGESVGKAEVSADTVVSLFATVDKFGIAAASDVVAGKTFTSAAGLLTEGTRSPLLVAMGTADQPEISTGLSAVSGMVLYRNSADGAGLVCAVYSGSGTWCICASGDGAFDVLSGAYCGTELGTLQWNGEGDAALAENVTYSWTAWGEA